jgi:ribonuclease R
VTELGNDYFHYDKAHHEMAGERTGVRYRLGDRLTIKVVRVDLETTKIDFTLVNKNIVVDSESNVISNNESTTIKLRAGDKKPVKSNVKFDGRFGAKPASSNKSGSSSKPDSYGKAGSSGKPSSSGKAGSAEKSRAGTKASDGKPRFGSKPADQSAGKPAFNNGPKPTKSKKSHKKTTKR